MSGRCHSNDRAVGRPVNGTKEGDFSPAAAAAAPSALQIAFGEKGLSGAATVS